MARKHIGIQQAETALCNAALVFAREPNHDNRKALKDCADAFSRARRRGRDRRDKYKMRNRKGESS